ncbi:hypothetical protein HDU83_008676 [Entophlyctis luteolus]|nr:hypothetical protein HDU83_008676 [Entophlyctis luteolus]
MTEGDRRKRSSVSPHLRTVRRRGRPRGSTKRNNIEHVLSDDAELHVELPADDDDEELKMMARDSESDNDAVSDRRRGRRLRKAAKPPAVVSADLVEPSEPTDDDQDSQSDFSEPILLDDEEEEEEEVIEIGTVILSSERDQPIEMQSSEDSAKSKQSLRPEKDQQPATPVEQIL